MFTNFRSFIFSSVMLCMTVKFQRNMRVYDHKVLAHVIDIAEDRKDVTFV